MELADVVTRLPVLRDLPAATRERLSACARLVHHQAGEELWRRGQATSDFTFLVSGQVRLIAQHSEPRNLLIDVVDTPGALVCVPAVCCAAPYCCNAECGRTTEVLAIPRDEMSAGESSPMTALLLQQATQHGMSLCRRIREVTGSKVEQRVAAVLLRLADERGIPQASGVRLPSSLSRKDLAGLSGCATETLIRELAHLESIGAVSRCGRSLLVHTKVLSDYVYS